MSATLAVARAVALLLTGLYAGGVLFVVLAPSLTRLPAEAYVPYWQALNTDYGRAMPPLLLTCVAAQALTVALSWRSGGWSLALSVGALVLVVLTVVLTVAGMEPLNRAVNTWDAGRPPADWAEIRARWSDRHLIRTALALTAFGFLVVAQSTRPR
ncbi:DUF1772 domain-containing protein [Asanoa sp. WMMD1127]|uniref:DUF1772 domain-containing protein n=1 Tax=Asanoa sp. WMMD1127 TaxID=3016107 RepID=UPI002415A2DB|nr:DUF1772 domain-containing protein [Asanoa sp. WMMD1127]MDG4827443.1 DUF1772 domain-containing protein [Asanoa sp. WMMD1127]